MTNSTQFPTKKERRGVGPEEEVNLRKEKGGEGTFLQSAGRNWASSIFSYDRGEKGEEEGTQIFEKRKILSAMRRKLFLHLHADWSKVGKDSEKTVFGGGEEKKGERGTMIYFTY